MSARASRSQDDPLPHALGAIERMSEAIGLETQDLAGAGPVDYRGHIQRKSQGLLELSRLQPTLAAMRGHPHLRAALAELLGKLDSNHRLLDAKLKAARTVADVVSRAISEGLSDGTYSDQIWRENRR